MRTLMMMTVAVYAVGTYSFGGATMAQGQLGGSGEECRAGTWRVCGRLELVEGRSIAESQRLSRDDCGEPSDVIR